MRRSTPPSQDVSRLRNFGKSFAQTEPAGLAKARIMLRALAAMKREIGVASTLRVLVRSRRLAKGVDRPFGAFRDYLGGVLEANAAAAIHLAELRESPDDVVACDVTYCVYERVAAAFGDPRLCAMSKCAGDDVSFPRICAGIDAQFLRQSTLAAGAPCCDFRFERRREH